jgi:hypothetical protein
MVRESYFIGPLGSQPKALRIWLVFVGLLVPFAKFACDDQFIYQKVPFSVFFQ